jgi:ABC-2 type transport system ATP-binding protein
MLGFDAFMNTTANAIETQQLSFRYGDRVALDCLDITIGSQQIFCLLGPNGSGKTTLFRILTTLEPTYQGRASVFGLELTGHSQQVRRLLGVVFQSASLDRKLTVLENIRCQAALYGLSGSAMMRRIDEVVSQFGLGDRLHDYVETLSGGLKRRVELAKGMLHRPKLLLLDEPSTGLDPAARLDLWQALRQLQQEQVSVIMTTHLLEEADKADSIAIIDHGRLAAQGAPERLRAELGAQVLSIQASQPEQVVHWLASQNVSASIQQQRITAAGEDIAKLVAPLTEHFGDKLQSITLGRPSLEDVFVAKTGHQFFNEVSPTGEPKPSKKR